MLERPGFECLEAVNDQVIRAEVPVHSAGKGIGKRRERARGQGGFGSVLLRLAPPASSASENPNLRITRPALRGSRRSRAAHSERDRKAWPAPRPRRKARAARPVPQRATAAAWAGDLMHRWNSVALRVISRRFVPGRSSLACRSVRSFLARSDLLSDAVFASLFSSGLVLLWRSFFAGSARL